MSNRQAIPASRIRHILKTSAFSNFLNLGSIQLSNAVIMMMLYPLLARKVGLHDFGQAMVANALATLLGVIVNFGTSQSGVKDVAASSGEKERVASVFYSVLLLRLGVFILVIGSIGVCMLAGISFGKFFIFAIPVIVAEVLNPLFIYLGKEDLSFYNISNLVVKVLIIGSAFLLINGPEHAVWINVILGGAHSLMYTFLLLRIRYLNDLKFSLPDYNGFVKIIRDNFYLVGNNLSVQLQQSLMLLVLAKWGNASWIGAYSLCDKIIWSGRLLIMSVCNSVYPRATALFHSDQVGFENFNKNFRTLLAFVFSGISIGLAVLAPLIVRMITGHYDEAAILLLRIMAFLQLLAAINAFNVIELMIRGENLYIFRIALALLALAFISAFAIAKSMNLLLLGSYALLIELAALVMYRYVISRQRLQVLS